MSIKYIILHWCGTNVHAVTDKILKSYQLVIDQYGKEYIGAKQGTTASTAGMNSITYNISTTGGDLKAPLTKVQCEKLFAVTAQMCKKLNLTPDKVYTHHEIGEMCRNGSITKLLPNNKWLHNNIGKIDLTRLPYDLDGKATARLIRNKVLWYYNNK